MPARGQIKGNKWTVNQDNTVTGHIGKDTRILIDIDDLNKVSQYTWRKNKITGYIITHDSNYNSRKERKTLYLHHLILGKTPSKHVIDHINHIKEDNRKCNLRFATYEQNAWNSRKQGENSTSKYKGVDWNKQHKKWRARITAFGKQINIGFFDSEIDAAKAYNLKAIELHGNCAVLNQIS